MNDPQTTAGVSTPRGPEARPSAVIVAGNEETRVLLRGLVRLQHFHVIGESDGATDGLLLIRQHRPSLVLIDTNLVEGGALTLLQAAREQLPEARLVVVGSLDPAEAPSAQGPKITYLRKPFRIADFAKAIGRDPPTAPKV